jgi:hypothetical protein
MDALLPLLALLVAALCAWGIWRGLATGRPPGQRGLVGTRFEASRRLMRVQVALLLVLLLSALAAAFYLIASP